MAATEQTNQYMIQHIQSAREAIEQIPDNWYAYAAAVGALYGMLLLMAGVSELSTHESCFDERVTEELKRLLDALEYLGEEVQ